jgi:murein L,D-transpeptidase YafK
MKRWLFAAVIFNFFAFTFAGGDHFKTLQLKETRVKAAYSEKYNNIKAQLKKKNIDPETLNIFIMVLKKEEKLQVWAKNTKDKKYILLENYPVCKSSGRLGPKKKQGDLQVPEGFYHIVNFNPESKFHLSLSINYPNAYDKANSKAADLGNNICIHGSCVTIGCLPLTDELIKEVYILAVQAYNSGQKQIPVHIFPAQLNQENYEALQKEYKENKALLGFWENIRTGYNYFETHKALPKITVSSSGKHVFK